MKNETTSNLNTQRLIIPQNFVHPDLYVDTSIFVTGQKGLFSSNHIPKNTLIMSHVSHFTNLRTRTSIQVGVNEHIEIENSGALTNHSCTPTVKVHTHIDYSQGVAQVEFYTISDIEKNTEITFDYATTETHLTPELYNSFCCCGSKNCRKKMLGFFDLSPQQQLELIEKNLLAEHILLYTQTIDTYNNKIYSPHHRTVFKS